MTRLFTAVHQLICKHKEILHKTTGIHWYGECFACGHETKGITL